MNLIKKEIILKNWSWFFLAAVVVLFVIIIKFELKPSYLQSQTHKNLITSFVESALKDQKSNFEINFTELYGQNGQFQILHPIFDLSKWNLSEQNWSCNDERKVSINGRNKSENSYRSLECSTKMREEQYKDQFKNEILNQFLNNEIVLPYNFISKAPFENRWGQSYAYLLTESALKPFNTKEWVEGHLTFYKITELQEILSKYKIENKKFSIISQLKESEVEEIVRGASMVLTKDHMLIKNETSYGFSPLSYLVFNNKKFLDHVNSKGYEISPLSDESHCLDSQSNMCLTYKASHAMAYVSRYSLILYFGIILMIALVLFFIIKVQLEKNSIQNKRRLALQVLSHEFRTPVSSLLLLMEGLLKRQNQFSVKDQDALLRISSEVFKLQRIVEMSKNYLQADGKKIKFNLHEIPSINNWLLEFVENFESEIKCELLNEDQSLLIDPYWLHYVLYNLIQNAIVHGKPPILVKMKNLKGKLQISVEDHGICEFDSLNEMTDAFVKSSNSKGMGLGLNIIKLVVQDLGSELRFSKSPTCFNLILSTLQEDK